MVTFKTVRSSLYTGAYFIHIYLIKSNIIVNLYSSRSLALPINYRVIALFTIRVIHTVTAFNKESWLNS